MRMMEFGDKIRLVVMDGSMTLMTLEQAEARLRRQFPNRRDNSPLAFIAGENMGNHLELVCVELTGIHEPKVFVGTMQEHTEHMNKNS